MSDYLVETFYTCTFKITHKLDELNEKKLSELENRNDGEVKIIDVRLNNRKTKKSDGKKNDEVEPVNSNEKDILGVSSIITEKITKSSNMQDSSLTAASPRPQTIIGTLPVTRHIVDPHGAHRTASDHGRRKGSKSM